VRVVKEREQRQFEDADQDCGAAARAMCVPRAMFFGVGAAWNPRLGRILALPAGCLGAAALVAGLAWTELPQSRLLAISATSLGIFGA
jgi:hypothetical protein